MEIKDILRLILIQVGTFAVLIIVLRLLFYQHLNSALVRLKKLQEEALIKEANLREELERAKQERVAEVERGKQEAKILVETAKKEVEFLHSKMEEQAKEECQKVITYGKEEIDRMRQKLLADIEKQALSLSKEIISYIFTDKSRESLQRQLTDEIIGEIEKLDKQIFSVKTDKIKITTSFALTEIEKEQLRKILSAKVGFKVTVQEEIDQGLIAGLIIKMGEFVIDGSLQNKMDKVIPLIRKS